MTRQSKKSICVYCGHKTGKNPAFLAAAHDVGADIAKAGHRLIYGGGITGMMGAVAKGAGKYDADILGIIPKHLFDRERAGGTYNNVILTDTMHERKKLMVMNSDAFVLLPGGLGSLDEFFELVTWRQIGLHDKPCLILNIAGFWDPLLALIEQQIELGFVPTQNRDYYSIYPDTQQLAAKLREL